MDILSDLYSLGHVLFHAITGVTAIADRKVNDAIESHTTGRIRKLSAMRRDLPKEICDWTHSLMETRPCDRPDSAAHALQLFNALLKQMNPVTSPARASRR